jgi:ribosomal protein L11 methylase PrmA
LAARLHIAQTKFDERIKLETKEKLMNAHRTIFASVGVMALFASASFAQQVKTDYDRSANFSQYKTYSWEKVQTQDQLWASRIQEAVTPVASGGDIAIVAIETTQNQQTLNTFYDGFGGGWRWRGFGGFGDATTTTENYKVGTLVVDLFDTHTKTLIWRGSSSDTLSDKSDKNIKNLDKGVQKMFDHFPPGEKK